MNGRRIFGEAVNTNEMAATMNCGNVRMAFDASLRFQNKLFYLFPFVPAECSRLSATVNQLIDAEHRQYSLRCLDDGSFDPLQCMGDKCMCVNQTNALAKSRVYTVGGARGTQLNRLPCCKY